MKLRQAEDRGAGPVDRKDLNPGDKVEDSGRPYLIRAKGSEYFACNMDTGYLTNHRPGPLFRIRITGTDDDGKLTWKRIGTEPKRVTQDDLVAGDWVSCDGALCVVYDGEATRYGHPICAFTADGHRALWHSGNRIIYRAEICGFEPGENGEDGTLIWRRK